MPTDTERRLERDWRSMIRISHDFFHAWRKAVADAYGDERAAELELAFWAEVGKGTANAYLERSGDPEDLFRIVDVLRRASDVMGEVSETRQGDDGVRLVHTRCPWPDGYRSRGLAAHCGDGCDAWFRATAFGINPAVTVTTECRIPDGARTCTRLFSRA